MSTGTDRARLQTLTDAIIAAQLAAQRIPPDERVEACSYGEFAEGGWYWEVSTERRGLYGNTKQALAAKPADYRDHNLREVIASGMSALTRETRKTTDHLYEAMQLDIKLVLPDEAKEGFCPACAHPTGTYHDLGCLLAYPDRAKR